MNTALRVLVWTSVLPLLHPLATLAQSRPTEVFNLVRSPLPAEAAGQLGWFGGSLEALTALPAGVQGGSGMSGQIRMSSTQSYQIILTRPAGERQPFERLYVDKNGNGRFEADEWYDLSRSSDTVKITGSQRTQRTIAVSPIRLCCTEDQTEIPGWVSIQVYDRPDSRFFLHSSITCLKGKVKFGDREMLMAMYLREPFSRGPAASRWRFDIPKDLGRYRSQYVQTGNPIFIDFNGNGQFDQMNPWNLDGEAVFPTRLIRVDGNYHEFDFDPNTSRVRISPAKPQLGKLTLPENVATVTVAGPEFAVSLDKRRTQIELPVGRYIALTCKYQTSSGTIDTNDSAVKNVFEVTPGVAATFQAGPPLEFHIFSGWSQERTADGKPRQGRTFSLRLEGTDCVGRRLTNVMTATGKRPPAPRFKIVDSDGKTVHSGQFEYG